MGLPANSLVLDVGLPGRRVGDQPFRVEVSADAVAQLIDDAAGALRVYELFAVRRPGDLLKYLSLTVLEAPPDVRRKAARFARPTDIGLLEFWQIFESVADDRGPIDEAWFAAIEGDSFRGFVANWFEAVRAVQHRLRNDGSRLVRNEIRLLDRAEHPFDRRPEVAWQRKLRRCEPHSSAGDEALAAVVAELLDSEDIDSVSAGYGVAFPVLRLLCERQLQRAESTGSEPFDAFPIFVVGDPSVDADVWGAHVGWFFEGIAFGQLHLESADIDARSLAKLLESSRSFGGRLPEIIVCAFDAGDLTGFRRTETRGLHVYRRERRLSRHERHALSRTPWSRWRTVLDLDGRLQIAGGEPFVLIVDTVQDPNSSDARDQAALLAAIERESSSSFAVLTQPDLPLEQAVCERAVRLFGERTAARHAAACERVGAANVVVALLEGPPTPVARELMRAARQGGATTCAIAPPGSIEADSADLTITGNGWAGLLRAHAVSRRDDPHAE